MPSRGRGSHKRAKISRGDSMTRQQYSLQQSAPSQHQSSSGNHSDNPVEGPQHTGSSSSGQAHPHSGNSENALTSFCYEDLEEARRERDEATESCNKYKME